MQFYIELFSISSNFYSFIWFTFCRIIFNIYCSLLCLFLTCCKCRHFFCQLIKRTILNPY